MPQYVIKFIYSGTDVLSARVNPTITKISLGYEGYYYSTTLQDIVHFADLNQAYQRVHMGLGFSDQGKVSLFVEEI